MNTSIFEKMPTELQDDFLNGKITGNTVFTGTAGAEGLYHLAYGDTNVIWLLASKSNLDNRHMIDSPSFWRNEAKRLHVDDPEVLMCVEWDRNDGTMGKAEYLAFELKNSGVMSRKFDIIELKTTQVLNKEFLSYLTTYYSNKYGVSWMQIMNAEIGYPWVQ